MEIIRLDPSRWEEYKQLRLESIQDSPEAFLATVDETLAEPDSTWQNYLQNMFFAVDENQHLVGMIACVQEEKAKLAHIVNVYSFYVSPQFRGQGIGKQLLQTAIAHAKSLSGVSKIKLGVMTTQTAARQLYESLGFQTIGISQQAVKVDESYLDEYLMELFL